MSEHIDILFDGPPGPEGPRFVEVENDARCSIKLGEWIERDDGYWALRIPDPESLRAEGEQAREAYIEVLERWQTEHPEYSTFVPERGDLLAWFLSYLSAIEAEAKNEREACAEYLKDGELISDCIKRNRKDVNAVMSQLHRTTKRAEAAEARVADLQAEVERLEKKATNEFDHASSYHSRWMKEKARADALQARLERVEGWLNGNTTYCDDGNPVLAEVSRRIWYHATDDTESWPFSKVMEQALKE